MNLDDKRKVIEILLCTGMERGGTVAMTAYHLDHESLAGIANAQWWGVDPSPYRLGGEFDAGHPMRQYELDATEAAYRLIETSPTLRREWFGAR